MERVWLSRLRWRMRGAWLWPSFAGLTVLEGVLVYLLPPAGDGLGLVPALLVAGLVNLVLVAVLGGLGGRLVRRRRPDMPKVVADDYAGSALVAVVALAFLAAGLAHRPAIAAQHRRDEAEALAVHRYVLLHAPAPYRAHLAASDTRRVEADLYRTCIPGDRPDHPLCMYVSTDQSPPGVRVDPSRVSNAPFAPGGLGP